MGFDGFACSFKFDSIFFAVLDDFSYGFAVSNRPQSPPPQRLVRENSYLSYCLVPLLQELFEKENEGDVPLLNGVNPNETLEPKVLLYGKYISLSLSLFFFFFLLVQLLVSWTSYQEEHVMARSSFIKLYAWWNVKLSQCCSRLTI